MLLLGFLLMPLVPVCLCLSLCVCMCVSHVCPAGVGDLLRLLCPVTGGLMWRTAKADVQAEMGIPPQHHHTTVLRLSAIERHWYNRYRQATTHKHSLQQDVTGCVYVCLQQWCRGIQGLAVLLLAAQGAVFWGRACVDLCCFLTIQHVYD